MSHHILNEHPDWVSLETQLVGLQKERDKAPSDQQARMTAYYDAVNRATTGGTADLPTPPQSVEAIAAAFNAQYARLQRERDGWLMAHCDELDEASREREVELLAKVADAVAVIDSVHQELVRLHSVRGSIAFQTGTARPVMMPEFRTEDLITAVRQHRNPLRGTSRWLRI